MIASLKPDHDPAADADPGDVPDPHPFVFVQVHASLPTDDQAASGQQRAPWLAGVFDGASQALVEGIESLCSFIGIKVSLNSSGR